MFRGDGSEFKIESESNRTTVKLTFHSILGQTTNNLFRKVSRIVFSHTLKYGFKNDTLGAFADVFVCRNYLNTILAKLRLVVSRVITITSEPVQFSNNDNIKHILCRILNHFLKRRTLVGSSGERSVNI